MPLPRQLAQNFQILLNPNLQDINPILAGEAECPPGLVQQPPRRDCTTIHYIRSGCGTLHARGKTYHVSAGQIFLILPGENVNYIADKESPWSYRWVGFTGASARRFSELPPVVSVPESVFSNLCDLRTPGCNLEYQLTSELFHLQGLLLMPKEESLNPVQWVVDHVQTCYMQNLSVQQMADFLNIDRSYLFRQFKQKMGLSVKEYIQKVRTGKAKWYLEHGYSVKETAKLCGFGSTDNFSRQFKRSEAEMTPSQWQQYMKEVRRREANEMAASKRTV